MEGCGAKMNKDLFEEQIEKFLNYVRRTKKFSKNTAEAYRNDLEKFVSFLKKKRINDFSKVDKGLALEYVEFLKGNLKERSVFRNVSSLRGFFTYLKKKGAYKGGNPFSPIKLKKTEDQKPVVLTVNEFKKLIKVLNEDGFINLRNKVIVLFTYSTGLRATEMVNAKVDNLNLRKAVYKCEMNHKRIIPFSKELVPLLKKYLKERKKFLSSSKNKAKDAGYLFVNKRGRKLTRQTIYIIIQTAAEDAGLKIKVTPSVLRNSLSWHLLSSGTNLETIKSIFGYKTIIPNFGKKANVKRVRFDLLTKHPAFRKK